MAVEGIKVPTISSTDTLTNKRKQPRVVIVTQSATPAINTDNGDIIQITGLAQAITSMSSGLTGTPVAGEMLMIQITDNGTAQGITWGASFASTTNSTLPTTTIASTILRTLFQRNNANTLWECVTTTAISVGISRSISSIAIATTGLAVASTDYVYIATAGVVFTLPTAVGNTNEYTLKATVTGVSFATTSAQTVDGSTTGTLVANQSITFISNGTNWFII